MLTVVGSRESSLPRLTRGAVMLLLLALAISMIAGCSAESADTGELEESSVPTNVLPDAGSPVVYEFYTDT